MTIPTCPDCGRQHVTPHGHQSCAKHRTKRDEHGNLVPCGRPPLTGSDACTTHGAGAPQVREAAGRRKVEQDAAAMVATLGLPVDISPTDALLQEVQWTAGHVQWLRAKVQEIDPQGLVWGTTERKENAFGLSETQKAAASIWYELYAKERAHLVAVSTAALRAGVEERRVRLAEQQGDLVAEVIRRILDALNLTDEQQALVPTIVPRELRVIAGGAA